MQGNGPQSLGSAIERKAKAGALLKALRDTPKPDNPLEGLKPEADLLVKLPEELSEVAWDVILIDSPAQIRVESYWTTRRLMETLCNGTLTAQP